MGIVFHLSQKALALIMPLFQQLPSEPQSPPAVAAAESPATAPNTGRKRRGHGRWLLRALCAGFVVSGISWYALHTDPDMLPDEFDVETTAALTAPPPAWDPVANPAVLFAFDMPELDLPSMTVEARSYHGGGRADALSIGTINDPFYLRVVIDRSQQPRSTSFYVDLARNAAQAGLAVKRSAQADELSTKFGILEMMPATLARATENQCLAFRGKALDGSVNLQGWLCGDDMFVADDMLACFLDRLTATPALRERQIEPSFRALDKNRTAACASALPRITAQN